MLRKLIKHEWLRLWKVPTFLLILLQALAVVAGLTFLKPVFESEIEGLRMLNGLVVASFFIATIGVTLGVYIYLALQFYKSTYSDEGYLTHTLPVSSHQILISKISIMVVWQIVTILGVLLACIIFTFLGLASQGRTWSDLWLGIEFVLKELEELYGFGRKEWINTIFATVAGGIVSVFYYGTWMTASMSIGQLGKKHRIATSIGAACLISFVLSSVHNIFTTPSYTRIISTENIVGYMLEQMWIVIAVDAVAVVVLYFISEYILRNKLNLE